jgi:poly(3-hydroxybutyrate) depolymerase
MFYRTACYKCFFSLLTLLFLSDALRAQTAGSGVLFKDPIGSFISDSSLGNTAPPITVWYFRPDNVSPATSVVFLMHGSTRTGQEARDLGTPYAKRDNFVLLAPEFSEKNYPGDTYAFGNMINTDGKPVPESKWAFGVIERAFDTVRHELRLSTESYDIMGHSAGGQFVHRLVLFAPQSRFRRAVASSPGRYALPMMSARFPYGFKGSALDSSVLVRAFFRDVVLVLGDRDTSDRVREAEAMTQGGNRFARGLRFFAAATEEANALKVPLAWRLRIAYGADHSPNAAVQAGFEELLR